MGEPQFLLECGPGPASLCQGRGGRGGSRSLSRAAADTGEGLSGNHLGEVAGNRVLILPLGPACGGVDARPGWTRAVGAPFRKHIGSPTEDGVP